MADLTEATSELFGRAQSGQVAGNRGGKFTTQLRSSRREVSLLSPGLLHLEYRDDADHVFLVTVQKVPRVAIDLDDPVAVGSVIGHQVRLVHAALANHVELTLEIAEDKTSEADPFVDDSKVGPEGPIWPADRIMHLTFSLVDDKGTVYQFSSGEAGGTGRERVALRRYLPLPPPQARWLTLTVTSPGGAVNEVDLPLPDVHNRHADPT